MAEQTTENGGFLDGKTYDRADSLGLQPLSAETGEFGLEAAEATFTTAEAHPRPPTVVIKKRKTKARRQEIKAKKAASSAAGAENTSPGKVSNLVSRISCR